MGADMAKVMNNTSNNMMQQNSMPQIMNVQSNLPPYMQKELNKINPNLMQGQMNGMPMNSAMLDQGMPMNSAMLDQGMPMQGMPMQMPGQMPMNSAMLEQGMPMQMPGQMPMNSAMLEQGMSMEDMPMNSSMLDQGMPMQAQGMQ